MSASAASLSLTSFTTRALSLCSPKPTSVFFYPLASSSSSSSSSSVGVLGKPISICASFSHSSGSSRSLSSGFVINVAVSSDYDQEEEVFGDGDESDFAPDLKLFVGNLPFSVDSSQLAGLFESAGNVQMVEVIYDKITGRSRGFGFVTMSTLEEVKAAAQQFNGYELDSRALRVNYGPPPTQPRREESLFRGSRGGGGGGGGGGFDNSNRVYVGNLSWNVDNSTLETFFSEQGKVLEAKVVFDRDSGRSRGFGFVTYSSAEEVDSAIESLNGADLNGRAIRVTVAESRPRRF